MSSQTIRKQNNFRARRALAVLRAYEKANDPGGGVETALYDLLTDMMHWGSRLRRHSSIDKFEAALAFARECFEAEERTGEAF